MELLEFVRVSGGVMIRRPNLSSSPASNDAGLVVRAWWSSACSTARFGTGLFVSMCAIVLLTVTSARAASSSC